MQGDSPKARTAGAREVSTNQTDIYDKLEEVVRKYALSSYLRPIADHTRTAFAKAVTFVRGFYPDLRDVAYKVILDSGCGTGESTVNIALAHPDIPVIGIDKSVTRLAKAGGAAVNNATLNSAGALPPNAFLVRAELLDFWRLALEAVTAGRWSIPYHALYYPNPWPKQSEATRRFHLHPIFPTLLQLGDTIELRTNWEIYAREFAEAVRVAKSAAKILPIRGPCALSNKLLSAVRPHFAGMTTDRIAFTPKQPITAFERKYKEARQQLWRVVISNKT